MRTVTCPDCGHPVEIPTVSVGSESVLVQCPRCLWDDLDSLYGARGLVVWGGFVEEMACWTCVPPGNGLQAAINALGSAGGNLMLQPGTYTGNITVPTTVGNVHLFGSGIGVTFLSGSVTVETSNFTAQDLTILGTGQTYACKIYKLSAGESRNHFTKVWFGASSVSSGDGPAGPGLYLDGAILTVCDHCVFAFTGSSGLFVDTSDPGGVFTTNVNTFRDCTFNGNARYGVEMIQGSVTNGMMLHKFDGGNIEDNTLGGFWAQECTFIIIRGMDFENSISVTDMIFMSNCQPVLVEDNNFVIGTGKTATRFFEFNGCAMAVVRRNRISGAGTWTAGAVGVFNEDCVQSYAEDNLLFPAGAGRWINNRGQFRGTSS